MAPVKIIYRMFRLKLNLNIVVTYSLRTDKNGKNQYFPEKTGLYY